MRNIALAKGSSVNGPYSHLLAGVVFSLCIFLLPLPAFAGSQTFTASGTFTVPSYSSLTVTVNGSGGGGGGGGGGAYILIQDGGPGGDGTSGGTVSFNGTVIGNGGGFGTGGTGGTQDASGGSFPGTNGSNGSGGTASGGDTNTTGAGAGGGTGGGGGFNANGDCQQSLGGGTGGNGAAGGKAVKTYSVGQLTPGAGITVTVGNGGTLGSGGSSTGCAAYGTPGDAGTKGSVAITWTEDITAPTPNPATFSSAPAPASASSVSMTASTASDPSTPVQYIFNFSACGANGGTGGASSAWTTSASYTNSTLQPNQCYGYTTQSRDSLLNTTTASAQSTTYTLANVPSAPTLSGASYTTMVISNNGNGNPTANPATLFAAQVTTADANWNTKYIDSAGNASATAVWLTNAQLTNLTINSLTAGTSYTIAVKARNNNNVETAFGTGATLSTTSITAPTVTTNSAQSFTPDTANLFGAITATNGANATQSGFAYGTVSNLSTVIATTTLGAQTGTASFTSAINSLNANTTYYYRAYATNSGGTGYGSILSFSTGNATPTRKMRLFEGYKIKLISGKLKLIGN